MIRSETPPTDSAGQDEGKDALYGMLSAVLDILGEMADAEAEATYRIPCAPCSPLAEGLESLFNRLRRSLIVHAGRCSREDVLATHQSVIGKGSPDDSGLVGLDDTLGNIMELALSSDWPSITWKEIEARFEDFARQVAEHLATMGDFHRASADIGFRNPK